MAQETENKKTALDDNAAIYSSAETRSDERTPFKEKWNKLDAKGKRQYFKDYLMLPIIIGLAVIIIGGYIIKSVMTNKTTVYYFASVNAYYMDENAMQDVVKDLTERWGVSGKSEVVYNNNLSMERTTSAYSSFETFMLAGSLDMVIGSVEQLQQYGYYFENFEVYMPDLAPEIPDKAKVELKFVDQDVNTGETKEMTSVCALKLTETVLAEKLNPAIAELGFDADTLIIAFPVTDHNNNTQDYGEDFVRYLLGMDPKN